MGFTRTLEAADLFSKIISCANPQWLMHLFYFIFCFIPLFLWLKCGILSFFSLLCCLVPQKNFLCMYTNINCRCLILHFSYFLFGNTLPLSMNLLILSASWMQIIFLTVSILNQRPAVRRGKLDRGRQVNRNNNFKKMVLSTCRSSSILSEELIMSADRCDQLETGINVEDVIYQTEEKVDCLKNDIKKMPNVDQQITDSIPQFGDPIMSSTQDPMKAKFGDPVMSSTQCPPMLFMSQITHAKNDKFAKLEENQVSLIRLYIRIKKALKRGKKVENIFLNSNVNDIIKTFTNMGNTLVSQSGTYSSIQKRTQIGFFKKRRVGGYQRRSFWKYWFTFQCNRGGVDCNTALHLAVSMGQEAIAHYLLSKGASKTILNIRQQTPSQLAQDRSPLRILVEKYRQYPRQPTILPRLPDRYNVFVAKTVELPDNARAVLEKIITIQPVIDSFTTHIVVNHGPGNVVMVDGTILRAMLGNILIMRLEWLQACIKAGNPVEFSPVHEVSKLRYNDGFIVEGTVSKCRKSREKMEPGLFRGCTFYLLCQRYSASTNDKNLIPDLIKLAEGILILREPRFIADDPKPFYAPHLTTPLFVVYDEANSFSIPSKFFDSSKYNLVSARWIIESIVEYTIKKIP
uniref:ANK_REP_REGION domain-containing protein n=1 Tax=Heterorhabditis bacteriophora TaxID=37862 RepID=A0A1I7WY70_HETBA